MSAAQNGCGAAEQLSSCCWRFEDRGRVPRARTALCVCRKFLFDLIRCNDRIRSNKVTMPASLLSTPRHCHAARAALRLAHEQPRAEHARHPHCTPASLASDAHALPQQHALTRKMLGSVLESLATGWPSAGSPLAHPARTRSANTLAACSAREPDASPTRCACRPPPPQIHNDDNNYE